MRKYVKLSDQTCLNFECFYSEAETEGIKPKNHENLNQQYKHLSSVFIHL